MLKIVQTGAKLSEVAGFVSGIGKQTRFATAVALTRTGQHVKNGLRREMEKVFDRPTPYTLNSLYLKGATKANLEAVVWLKDDTYKGTPAARYLGPQIDGGGRSLKRSEKWLSNYVDLRGNVGYWVPGEGARLNQYGNMTRGQIVKILANLQALPDRASRTTDNRKIEYFIGQPAGAPLGVWRRDNGGIAPVMIFIRPPSYKRRFDFFGVGDRIVKEHYPKEFDRAYSEALKTAR